MSNPTIQNTDRNSLAFSASPCACADPRGAGANPAVADKPKNTGLMDWEIRARAPSPARVVRRIPLRCD